MKTSETSRQSVIWVFIGLMALVPLLTVNNDHEGLALEQSYPVGSFSSPTVSLPNVTVTF